MYYKDDPRPSSSTQNVNPGPESIFADRRQGGFCPEGTTDSARGFKPIGAKERARSDQDWWGEAPVRCQDMGNTNGQDMGYTLAKTWVTMMAKT
jgi:hypothetical protein